MRVKLTYFKRSGKFYASGFFDVAPVRTMDDIWDAVRYRLRIGQLPGLVESATDFVIHVDVPRHPHRHPRLIL